MSGPEGCVAAKIICDQGRLRAGLGPPDVRVHIGALRTKARSSQAFRLKGFEGQVSPANGYEKPELPNSAAQSAARRDPALNMINNLNH